MALDGNQASIPLVSVWLQFEFYAERIFLLKIENVLGIIGSSLLIQIGSSLLI